MKKLTLLSALLIAGCATNLEPSAQDLQKDLEACHHHLSQLHDVLLEVTNKCEVKYIGKRPKVEQRK